MDESLLKIKIDWRGRLYLNRAGTLVPAKCRYNNPNMIEKLCTHDCALFHEPEPDLLFEYSDKEYIRISLCVGSVYCKVNEFLDQRVCLDNGNSNEEKTDN